MRNDMGNKRALNLSLEPEIIAWLDKIMEARHYTSRSVLVEELIRERYDLVFGSGNQSGKNEAREVPAAATLPAAKKKRAA